jgi:glutathione S-transferase
MADYTLYYWPIPFRGEFVRATLAHVGADWIEADPDEVGALMEQAPAEQPVAHMGPPVLVDHRDDFAVSQTAAILTWLGGKHGLMPEEGRRVALTAKVLGDVEDVLYEMTLHNGAQRWTRERWAAQRPRLARWMEIFEATGHRHGLTAEEGHLLGGDAPGVADLATAVLWGTMTRQLPPLRTLLEASAPTIAALADRVEARPKQAARIARGEAVWGDAWCGGEIEASLREALEAD